MEAAEGLGDMSRTLARPWDVLVSSMGQTSQARVSGTCAQPRSVLFCI